MPQPPTLGGVTSPYGMRTNPNDGKYRMHWGEDTIGEGNYAPVSGQVLYAGYDTTGTGLGWAVGIRAADGSTWWVAHHGSTAKENPLRVNVGDRVTERRTYLGPSGTSGAAKGRHAHTERRTGISTRPGQGTPSDPRLHYRTTGGGPGGGLPEGAPMTLYFQYNGSVPAGAPTLAAVDPAQGVYRYPSKWEIAAIQNEVTAGRAMVNPLGSPEWEETFGPLRLVTNPNASAEGVDSSVVQVAAKAGAAEAMAELKFPTYGPVA